MRVSGCDQFKLCLDPEGGHLPKVGDVVRTGTNAVPLYRVVAIEGDKTWLRDEDTGADYIVPLCRCRTYAPAAQ